MKKYLKIWWIFTVKTSQIAFVSRFSALLFLSGKIVRFFLFLFFLSILFSRTKAISGYSLWQMVFFFATFNLIDTTAQFLFREVYRFRNYVVSGFFDHILTKPFSPLFRVLLGGSDVLDLAVILSSLGLIIFTLGKIPQTNLANIIFYFLLIFNSLVISFSLHVFVVSIGILTTEVDNMILLYRDFISMGRVSVDIYKGLANIFLTFIIPVGVMITFPAKALMGLFSFSGITVSFLTAFVLLVLSLYFWKFSLKYYSSASS